jgi:hypothetical protein
LDGDWSGQFKPRPLSAVVKAVASIRAPVTEVEPMVEDLPFTYCGPIMTLPLREVQYQTACARQTSIVRSHSTFCNIEDAFYYPSMRHC